MGVVIFSGLSIGTLFTLFVVPAMYLFLAGEHRAEAPTGPSPDGLASGPATAN